MTGILIFQICQLFCTGGSLAVVAGIGAASVTYAYQLIYRKKLMIAIGQNLWLALFVLQALLWCALSYAGLAGWLGIRDSYGVDMSYLPRQAYYLFFLPMISTAACFCSNGILAFVRQYSVLLFVVVYLVMASAAGKLLPALSPITMVLLGALALATLPPLEKCPAKRNHTLQMRWWKTFGCVCPSILLLLLPVEHGGSACTLLLKLMLLGLLLVRQRRIILALASLCLPVLLVCSFVLPQLPGMSERISDANVKWRLEYWADAGDTLLKTWGVGIGYGTSYGSRAFTEPRSHGWYEYDDASGEKVWQPSPLGANDEYTAEQRPFVTATHNSIVAVALRTGVLGLFLFCAALIHLWRQLCKREKIWQSLIFLFCGCLLCISVNVGLENPSFLTLFITSMSMVQYAAKEEEGQKYEKGVVGYTLREHRIS